MGIVMQNEVLFDAELAPVIDSRVFGLENGKKVARADGVVVYSGGG